MTRCGHCTRDAVGTAGLNDVTLCHPDHGLDCYRLVTLYHHPTPCSACRDVRILLDVQDDEVEPGEG